MGCFLYSELKHKLILLQNQTKYSIVMLAEQEPPPPDVLSKNQKTIEKTMPICYYQFKHYIFRFCA